VGGKGGLRNGRSLRGTIVPAAPIRNEEGNSASSYEPVIVP
jgi:hypothetical protein